MNFAVLHILTGSVKYHGRTESKAADALEPGHCYGKGASKELALLQAERIRTDFLRGGYKEAV